MVISALVRRRWEWVEGEAMKWLGALVSWVDGHVTEGIRPSYCERGERRHLTDVHTWCRIASVAWVDGVVVERAQWQNIWQPWLQEPLVGGSYYCCCCCCRDCCCCRCIGSAVCRWPGSLQDQGGGGPAAAAAATSVTTTYTTYVHIYWGCLSYKKKFDKLKLILILETVPNQIYY